MARGRLAGRRDRCRIAGAAEDTGLATHDGSPERPRAPAARGGWRTVAALTAGFAILAAGLYGVVALREQQAHHGPQDRVVVVNPHG